MPNRLPHYPVTHSLIRKILHPRLGVQIDNQSVARTLRFRLPQRLDHLELPRSVYGRWTPAVPTHPAHLLISTPDFAARRWNLVREVDLPFDPRTAGLAAEGVPGLSQEMESSLVEEHFARLLADPPYRVDLAGLESAVLRVECDREHPVWPNHGECNGSPYSVPFGILDPLLPFGTGPEIVSLPFARRPGLRLAEFAPQAPAGMRVRQTSQGILFEGPRFSIGFSLRRPMLIHLGWDAFEQSAEDRMKADWAIGIGGQAAGLSGPLLRTFDQDFGAQYWSGEVRVRGAVVEYSHLRAVDGLEISARFTVDARGAVLELEQVVSAEIPALEYEAWRFLWDLRLGMTAPAAAPTCAEGRAGQLNLPLAFATDGRGALVLRQLSAAGGGWSAQAETFRSASVSACGLAPTANLASRSDGLTVLTPGRHSLALRMDVDAFAPVGETSLGVETGLGAISTQDIGLRRHWGTVFACFRPEHRGFSNNAASVNCHVSQYFPAEAVALTRPLGAGADEISPAAMLRFTLERALLDGGGYGYWRNLYLDSDPGLLAAAGRLQQVHPDPAWLARVRPGLEEAARRVLALRGEDGLLVCRDLSGNAGSYRWSCNSMDVIGFGHKDAYVNALAYRGLRCGAALFAELGDPALSGACAAGAAAIRGAYRAEFLNPRTGWLAGWRSRDGQLHDYGFIWVNGPAIAFGLLDAEDACSALLRLEAARVEVGAERGVFGLPGNLYPIDPADHMMPLIWATATPTFESYTDGGYYGYQAAYYLRALSINGRKDALLRQAAAALAADLEEGLAAGNFNGGLGQGNEFRTWDGLRTGYEGTLIGSFAPVYSLAIERGLLTPTEPEWWPAGG
jgi:hypothetical protein